MEFQAGPSGKSTKNFVQTKSTISKVKHGVLKNYLCKWLAMLYRNPCRIKMGIYSPSNPQYSRIVYVDGFCGPGKYSDGELGSPIVAYETALNIKLVAEGPEICMIFIDKNAINCEKLVENLKQIKQKRPITQNDSQVKCMVISGEFVRAMEWILSGHFTFPTELISTVVKVPPKELQFAMTWEPFIGQATPFLVFADPFGYNGKDMPMTLMKRIMNISSKSEIMVTLMTGSIRRFWGMAAREKAINLLLGNDERDSSWKPVVEGSAEQEKVEAFLKHYDNQLSDSAFACLFEMVDKQNKIVYNLYFASHHDQGFIKMKEAMVKQSQKDLGFTFSEFYAKKENFVRESITEEELKKRILEEFQGRNNVGGWEITGYLDYDRYLTQRFRNSLKRSLEEYCVTNPPNKRMKFDRQEYNFKKPCNSQTTIDKFFKKL